MIELFNDDCMDKMQDLINCNYQFDAIIADIPYGITSCKWDTCLDLKEMWELCDKLINKQGNIVLFGQQPFSSILVSSNIKNFKYSWIWNKVNAGNFMLCKKQPLKVHEDVLIFSNSSNPFYYPIFEERGEAGKKRLKNEYKSDSVAGNALNNAICTRKGKLYNNLKYPTTIKTFNNRDKYRGLHPTQKPILLMEYLIKTYTKENDLVLDFTMGSGTTGIACKNLNRRFVGVEKDEIIFNNAKKRFNNGN